MIESFIYKFKNNLYQKFFVKLFVLFITLVFLDFIIGSLLNFFYFKQQSGMLYRTTYSMEKTRADLLIFGSSTANHNYHPQVFQDRLKMSCYNAGRDGNCVFYHYAVLEAVLKRYAPKTVIYDFDVQVFIKDQMSYDESSSLLPYYKKHPESRSIVELKSPYEKYKLLSKIYPYNSSIFSIAIGNTELNKKRSGDIKGYIPLSKIWNEPIKAATEVGNPDLDSNKIRMYESFIKDCINSKVTLYIVCSPLLLKSDSVSPSIVLGRKIANKYNVKFLDYSKDSTILNQPGLFADIGHLNDEGARIFSHKVTDTIMPDDLKRFTKK